MITRLRIENFKAHRDTSLNLSNLTVLAGVNSAGKSSAVQALLLLRQSFLGGQIGEGLNLNEPLCAIGTGQDALCRMAESNRLAFELEMGSPVRFEYAVESDLTATFLRKADGAAVPPSDELSKEALFSRDFQYVSSLRYGGISHFEQYDFEVRSQRQISKRLGQCEAIAHFLHAFGGESTHNYLGDGETYALADQVELWERCISPDITIAAQKNPRGGFDIVYGYAHPGMKPLSDLRAENIGYGISHSLPIVTALLAARPGALVVIENPEAHLHPKAQMVLARLIAAVARQGVQVLVETHSDHILNGVRLAVKQGVVTPGQVTLNFMVPDAENGVVCLSPKVLPSGAIDIWPVGFFDEYENSAADLI